MKPTKELINQIKNRKKGDMDFLQEQDFKCPQIQYYLADLLGEKGISRGDFIREMNLERSYGYQIINGNRRPSRELLIRAALLLGLDLEETQRLLKIGKREILYPRVRKDALAIYAIEKGLPLREYLELLEEYSDD